MERHTHKYRIFALRTLTCRMIGLLPPAWREPAAEKLLRRRGSPGPAAEHAFQYLLSLQKAKRSNGRPHEAKVAMGADTFYEKQYRQFLNPTMGAFAATAAQAVLAAGGEARGHLWGRRRKTCAAVLEYPLGPPPLIVLNSGTVAVALCLPRLKRRGEAEQAARWLYGLAPMPTYFREVIDGESMSGPSAKFSARQSPAAGQVLEVLDAALSQRHLAVLALHPYDPDAMGLHITLFGIEAMWPAELAHRFGLSENVMEPYRDFARNTDCSLAFCVGATEEAFTQCSQNLFIKRPAPLTDRNPPDLTELDFEDFVSRQFEAIQITVSSGGLPGASPRNGDLGHAAFAVRSAGRLLLLIPYHPGNAVHGHAAKLWSNPYGSVILSDDHDTLRRITVSGEAHIASHAAVEKRFPRVAAEVMLQQSRKAKGPAPPDYWFVQEVAELVMQREPLAPNRLDAARASCSISAGGQALHGKKPDYFHADALAPYDIWLQRQRAAAGLLDDPSGARHRLWQEEVAVALRRRRQHLDALAEEIPEQHTSAASRDQASAAIPTDPSATGAALQPRSAAPTSCESP
jgi:hypothetical protein